MLTLFKPNKKNTGSALTISAANAQTKDGKTLPYSNGTVFVKLVKQEGWNDEKGNGFFKNNFKNKDGHIMIALGPQEVAEILQCIREKRCINGKEVDYSSRDSITKSTSEKYAHFFHRGADGNKTLKFFPAKENCSDGNFALSVGDITNRMNIGIYLTSAEARMIEEAFVVLLQKYFSHEIDSTLSYFTKNQMNKNSQKSAPRKEKSPDEDEFAEDDPELGSELEDDDDMPF